MSHFTSQLCNSPKRSQTEKHRHVRRAALERIRWTQRSMGTGGGSATHSPGREEKPGPLGEACCWSMRTGRSAAGMGDPPGTATGWSWARMQKNKTHHCVIHVQLHVWFKCKLLQHASFGVFFKWKHLGHYSSPAATLVPAGPESLWWSCRMDPGWSEPGKSSAAWSLSLQYREQEPTLPP